ncbi:class II fructose-bisphosphate aldolase [Brachybacterium sp. MASK1Z-5]|uniref:Class II fructose-bisphosphate aldolase n=1 Tax=Brachybacterium halotolerans TaxID=2795215 RepID=A0ABS1BBB8_9MICO|nr:class II fructose-bisphosphate aldolase [Brachybacterium halotolerans]MBK0331467.1 class II fructose-bisphosphate aldolase [Brachybacterium halotolerans]
MTLSALAPLAEQARAAHRGLAAFNVVHIENAEAFSAAAERTGLPIVMQISQNAATYHGGLAPIALATLEIGRRCAQDVVVHLDHADDLDLVDEALELGFTSIMYDGSKLPDAQNRARTREVAARAHARGVSVEAELGEVGGKDGVHDPSARTDPGDAAQFVADTGVDLLAVAVGSSHAMTTRDASLDLDLIRAIADRVEVPLVLHGSSGVSDQGIRDAVAAGMTKINVSTHLNRVTTGAVREILTGQEPPADTRKWFGPGRDAGRDEAARLLEVIAGRQPVHGRN